MAVYTDAFTGGTPGTTIVGANWSGFREAPGGFSHWMWATGGESVEPDTDAANLGVRYIGGAFGSAQYSQITLAQDTVSGGSTCYIGVDARCSGSTTTSHCYKFGWYAGFWFASHIINGTETSITPDISGAPSNLVSGTVLRIEVEDSGTVATIRGYYNGALVITKTHDHAGGALASGTGGFEAYNSGATLGKVGAWEGGDLGGGGSPYTLTADQGTLTIAGQVAGVLAARKLVSDQGSYALTGQNATLTKTTVGAFTLSADFGTYLWTGENALADYAMNAEFGIYSLSGQIATLTKTTIGAFVLIADSGTYSLIGQVADFSRGFPVAYTITADSGTYSITGRPALLLGPGDLPTLGPGDKYVKLALMGYTGALNNMLLNYYKDNGATSFILNEAEMQFLASQGATAVPLNNRRRQFYVSLGYTGSLSDMDYQYWWNL